MNKPKFLSEKMTADQFNEKYPSGSVFLYYPAQIYDLENERKIMVCEPATQEWERAFVKPYGLEHLANITNLVAAGDEDWAALPKEHFALLSKRFGLDSQEELYKKSYEKMTGIGEACRDSILGCRVIGETFEGRVVRGIAVKNDSLGVVGLGKYMVPVLATSADLIPVFLSSITVLEGPKE